MNTPNVSRFPATDQAGKTVNFTVSTDIVDYAEASRTFGREDLSDPAADGRFQRRMIAIPDKAGAVVTPMVLSISSTGGLNLVRKDREDQAAGDGWRLIDLGAALQAKVTGAGRVRAVSAAWNEDDRITIVVAIDDVESGRSRVFAAYGLRSRRGDWANIEWQDCGVRDDVRVEGIRILDDGKDAWLTVLSGDRGPNDMLYLLHSGDRTTFAKATVFNPAVTLEEILDFEAVLHPTQGPGIAVLGTNGGVRDLSFRPFPSPGITVPPVVPLPCPAGANVLETGLTRKVGRSGRLQGTDLYIGGQGIQLITARELYDQEEAEIVNVASPTAAGEVLDLVAGEGEDGGISVWALQRDGGLTVVRSDGSKGAPWSTPLRLRGNVAAIAPVHGDEHASTSLLTVYNDGRAAFICRDNTGAGVWQERALLVANPEEASKITCYGTSLRLLDAAGIPQPGKVVKVTASVLSSVAVNGRSAFIGPNLSTEATTDINGGIHLYDRVRSLTPAVYRFSVDGVSEDIDVNPSGGIHQRFQSITGDELRKATVALPGGGTEPLLAGGGGGAAQVDAVATAMQQASKLANSATGGGLPSGVSKVARGAGFSSKLRADAVPAGYRMGMQSTGGGVQVMDDSAVGQLIGAGDSVGQFFDDLGDTISDFFEGVVQTFKDGWQFIVHKLAEGYEFICKIGDQIKKFAVETFEQIGGMFTWLWEQVKTGVEKLWEFLKFIFDWEDIIVARNVMVKSSEEALKYFEGSLETVKEKSEEGINDAIAEIRKWQAEIGIPAATLKKPDEGESVTEKVLGVFGDIGDVVDKVMGNSVLGWVMDKAGGLLDEIVTIEGADPTKVMMDTGKNFVTGVIADEIGNLMTTFNQIGADASEVFGGEMPSLDDITLDTIKELLVRVGADVVVGLLEGVRDLVSRVIDLLKGMIEFIRAAMFAKIRFPFIEKLVELVAPGTDLDTSFSLAEAFMLLFAVPSTIAYKLIFNEAPFKKGEVLNLPLGRVTAQSYWVGAIMPYMAIAGGFLKLGVAGYQTKVAVAAKKNGDGGGDDGPSTKDKMGYAAALFFGGVGLIAEIMGRHHPDEEHDGKTINALELSGVGAAGFVVLVQTALIAAKWTGMPDSAEVEAAVSIVGNVALVGLGCGVFGVLIDYLRQSSVEYDQKRQMPESFRWLGRTFDQAGTMLIMTGVFLKDPVTKAIVIGSGAACKGGALTMTISQVAAMNHYLPAKPTA